MECLVSIIIASFQRAHLLKWNLFSLARQEIPFEFETIVLNDGIHDETETICSEYKEKLNLKYLFTGSRNQNGQIIWRVPGFSYNTGVKRSSGEILVLSCAEMFHFNDTVAKLTIPLLENRKRIGIPIGKDDAWTQLSFLQAVIDHNGNVPTELFEQCPNLNVQLPFLISVSRAEFMTIGGYDEDFIGKGFEDADLVERLQLNGCSYYQTDAKTVHLNHGFHKEADIFNSDLYYARKCKIIRNENREWGKL
jgi:glycosyltransferase involved in cell wall biosynthesis